MNAVVAVCIWLVVAGIGAHTIASAQAAEPDSLARMSPGPVVKGGYNDKPYVSGLFGRVRMGGYLEFEGAWVHAAGATEELSFQLPRLSLMASTQLQKRVSVWAEIEFEEGGEDIEVELAQVDFLLSTAANLRGGILLLPLGRFNLAHDGPRTELPRRPLVATDLVGSALSQPGMGVFGEVSGMFNSRFTYEAYAVNGYQAGLLEDSPEGTRLPAGAGNQRDANASPGLIARVGMDRGRDFSAGLSMYSGAYNRYRIEGVDVAERRNVGVQVVDVEMAVRGFRFSGEATSVRVELPTSFEGLFASRQAGITLEISRSLGVGRIRSIPDSWFTAVVRGEAADFDLDLSGDSSRALTFGLNFRPVPESVMKLACTRRWDRDRFTNEADSIAWVLGLASYF